MKAKSVFLLLVAAAAIGAVTGLLLAPGEGSETRKKWMKKAKKYKKQFEDKASDLKGKAKDFKENVEGAVGDVKKRFSNS